MANTLIASYLGQGLYAARPATPTLDTGCIGFYYATDHSQMYVYANSVWSIVGGGGASPFSPPLAATFPTIINTGAGSPSAAVVDTPTGMQFSSGPVAAGDSFRAAYKTIISATVFTVILGMRITMAPVTYRNCGLWLTDGTKHLGINMMFDGGGYIMHVTSMTNGTTFGANLYSSAGGVPFGGGDIFFKVTSDATTLKFFYSQDGQSWVEVYHELLANTLSTITKWGVGCDANGTTGMTVTDTIYATVFYEVETNP